MKFKSFLNQLLAVFLLALFFVFTAQAQTFTPSLEARANRGNTEAMMDVALCYSNGNGVEQSAEKAFFWALKAARKGNVQAQYFVAEAYAKGIGTMNDNEQAQYWMKRYNKQMKKRASNLQESNYSKKLVKNAQNGNAEAQFLLAGCYYNGDGVEQNFNDAYYWSVKSASQGHSLAIAAIGQFYLYGQGVAQNYEEAVKWFQKADTLNVPLATYFLGQCYENGNGVEENYSQAFHLYQRAAEAGVVSALSALGRCYYWGQGTSEDYQQAARCFAQAASQQDGYGEQMLGMCYEMGHGVEADSLQAFRLMKSAAEKGWVWAMWRTGVYYMNGYGVECDSTEAVNWLAKGGDEGSTLCMQSLAYLLHEKNINDTAIELLELASSLNDANAMNSLGCIYYDQYKEWGVEQDNKRAYDYLTKAVELGSNYAVGNLGEMYYKGVYVKRNPQKAFQLIKQSAEDKNEPNPDAMRRLSACYRYGVGTSKSRTKEKYWMEQAALYEDESAMTLLKEEKMMKQHRGTVQSW